MPQNYNHRGVDDRVSRARFSGLDASLVDCSYTNVHLNNINDTNSSADGNNDCNCADQQGAVSGEHGADTVQEVRYPAERTCRREENGVSTDMTAYVLVPTHLRYPILEVRTYFVITDTVQISNFSKN